MKNSDRWDEPDWENMEPVKFTGLQMNADSVFTAILLGGVLAGLALAIWYMVLSG